MKKFLPVLFSIIIVVIAFSVTNLNKASATELNDNINQQVNDLDLSELQEFFNDIENNGDVNFYGFFTNLLNGEYELDFSSIFGYIKSIFLPRLTSLAPTFLSIIAIGLFCAIINSIKANFFGDGISEIIFYVSFLMATGIIFSQFILLFDNTKNLIENIAKLSEIMSPIIITLMVASGGNVSAGIYKPAVAFLSSGIIQIILTVVLNLIFIMTVFCILSNFSSSVKLKKYVDFFQSVIKWIIGIIVTVFGIFLTVQGIASATFDGISAKAAKYAISNSVPLIGGFLKDGFDLIVAGSVIIKNSVGITVIFALFYMLISPLAYFFALNILLKLTSAIIESFGETKIGDMCMAISKSVSYLMISLLTVALMLFITVLLLIFSANAFI